MHRHTPNSLIRLLFLLAFRISLPVFAGADTKVESDEDMAYQRALWGSSLGRVVNVITKKIGKTARPTGTLSASYGHGPLFYGPQPL